MVAHTNCLREAEKLTSVSPCNAVFHTTCVGLTDVPEGDWFCQMCADAGVTVVGAGISARAAHRVHARRIADGPGPGGGGGGGGSGGSGGGGGNAGG